VPDAVFVYGTLMPGRLRWPILEPAAVATRPAEVAGSLWDTGRGWPAARFTGDRDRPASADAGVVPGWVVSIDPTHLDGLLVVLDEVEGAVAPGPDGRWAERVDARVPAGEYRRLIVGTADGEDAWAYEALAVSPRWTRIDAWADRPEA